MLVSDNIEVLELYLQCVYKDAVPDLAVIIPPETSRPHQKVFVLLVHLYSLCDMLQDPETANLVIDEFIDFSARI